MTITLHGRFQTPTHALFQRAGYHVARGYRGEEAYVRRIGRLDYPRFHAYIQTQTVDRIVVRIHLDQKRPSYHGSHAHAADYDSPALNQEAERLRSVLSG